jgi:hypothetical protein
MSSSILATPVQKVYEIATAFKSKTLSKVNNKIFARILRGKQDSDFLTMTHDLNRKIVFYLDSKGIEELTTLSDYDKLIKVGYPDKYIHKLLHEGYFFKIVIFKNNAMITSASWENVGKLVNWVHANQSNFYKNAYSQDMVIKISRNIPHLISAYSNIAVSSPEEVYNSLRQQGGELWEVRKYLHKNLNLNKNFTGNGKTYTDKGELGVPEFISPNIKISDLNESIIIDLKVVPSL